MKFEFVKRIIFVQSPEIPAKITVEILHQASYCMSIELCKQLGRVTLDYFNNAARNPYNFGPIAVPKVIQVSEVDKGILQVNECANFRCTST